MAVALKRDGGECARRDAERGEERSLKEDLDSNRDGVPVGDGDREDVVFSRHKIVEVDGYELATEVRALPVDDSARVNTRSISAAEVAEGLFPAQAMIIADSKGLLIEASDGPRNTDTIGAGIFEAVWRRLGARRDERGGAVLKAGAQLSGRVAAGGFFRIAHEHRRGGALSSLTAVIILARCCNPREAILLTRTHRGDVDTFGRARGARRGRVFSRRRSVFQEGSVDSDRRGCVGAILTSVGGARAIDAEVVTTSMGRMLIACAVVASGREEDKSRE